MRELTQKLTLEHPLLLLLALLLCACTPRAQVVPDGVTFEPVEETPEEAPAPVVIGVPYPQPIAGQAVPLPPSGPDEEAIEEAKAKQLAPHEVLDEANDRARQAPLPEGFINANLVYDYMPGAIYQLWSAPNHLTMINFAPGEEIYSFAAGDTLRWMVERTRSGPPDAQRLHLLVQPVRKGLHTTMIVTTSRGTYHFELKSYQHTYTASVSFNYQRQQLKAFAASAASANEARGHHGSARGGELALAVQLDDVETRYRLIVGRRRQRPSWTPTRVFHDGKKTYIDFGHDLAEREVPTLFLLSKKKTPELAQYTIHGRYMVIGQVVEFGVLQMGEDGSERVGIELDEEARR